MVVTVTKALKEAWGDSWRFFRSSETFPQRQVGLLWDRFLNSSPWIKLPLGLGFLFEALPASLGVPSLSDFINLLYDLGSAYEAYLRAAAVAS